MTEGDPELADHVFRLCQQLLRIDTTNPPGNELPAAEFLADELSSAGLDPVLLQSAPRAGQRRCPASWNWGEAATSSHRTPRCRRGGPLCLGPSAVLRRGARRLLVGPWCHRHEEHGRDVGGHHHSTRTGRGETAARSHLRRGGRRGGRLPLRFALALRESPPDLVRSEYALGEGGGFNIQVAGKSFFTVQVAEKGVCWVARSRHGGTGPRLDAARGLGRGSRAERGARALAQAGPAAPLVRARSSDDRLHWSVGVSPARTHAIARC